jgi:hypothetical protein
MEKIRERLTLRASGRKDLGSLTGLGSLRASEPACETHEAALESGRGQVSNEISREV